MLELWMKLEKKFKNLTSDSNMFPRHEELASMQVS